MCIECWVISCFWHDGSQAYIVYKCVCILLLLHALPNSSFLKGPKFASSTSSPIIVFTDCLPAEGPNRAIVLKE